MTLEEKEMKIIQHYGVLPQLKYFQSEIYELTEAIFEYEMDDYNYFDEINKEHIKHITEEIADVQLMLNQFKKYYDIKDEEIEKVMNFKADRQLDRIKRGN